MILLYQKSKTTSSLASRYQYNIDVFPSPTLNSKFFINKHGLWLDLGKKNSISFTFPYKSWEQMVERRGHLELGDQNQLLGDKSLSVEMMARHGFSLQGCHITGCSFFGL